MAQAVTYAEAIQFLYGLRLFGAKFGLENTRQLAALAGNPQDKLRFIHVAGTNGKGSTCAMLESIYRAAGLRVGLFTSPHLVSFRERIQINRQLIAESEVVRLVSELRGDVAAGILPVVEPGILPGGQGTAEPKCLGKTETAGAPGFNPGGRMPPSTAGRMPAATTFFEFVTVMALKFFAEQKCDLVIWETGLGGRLDATNIVTPLASVITNIAFDHEQWLGDTLEKIAVEKAGIIKPGVPVVTATDAPEALAVIEQVAQEKNAPLKMICRDAALRRPDRAARCPCLSLPGEHQKLNAALALATVEILQPQVPVVEEEIRAGLAGVNWPGRLQLIQRPGGQKILLDGAHNVAGAEALRDALETEFAGLRPVFIFGALADKKWPEICRTLAPLAAKVFTVPVASERTAAAAELAGAFQAANPKVKSAAVANLMEALNASNNEPFIVITGSLYLVGEALELLGLSPAGADERGLNEWAAPKNLR